MFHISRDTTISRRTMLHGMGVGLSLPFLEAMVPNAAAADSAKIPARMGVFHFGTGMNMREFEPTDAGPNFSLSPTLKVLERHRQDMTYLSGTYLEYGGGHTGDYTFLTGVQAHRNGGIYNAISADQHIADRVGGDTRFPSLVISVKRGTGFGGQGLHTLSWNKNGIPLASESDPHRIFNRLFRKDSPDEAAARDAEFRLRGSILDSVMGQANRLNTRVSGGDKQKLDEYFTAVREVEKQLQRNIDWADKPKPQVTLTKLGDYSKPSGPEDVNANQFSYKDYSAMMYDLVVLAFQTDSTRVLTYNVRRELSGGTYPEMGVSDDFHTLTHHNNDPRKLSDLAKVDRYYMARWAEFLDRMKSVKEVDGSPLLDHCMLAFGSGMGIGHSKDRLPSCLFGGKALGIKHQGHLELPENTPLAGLWHTMADRMGVKEERFQDSEGVIKQIIT